MFYDNFLQLCNQKGISPTAAVVEMGFQKSVVTRWKTSVPTDANKMRIANYFGVPADVLMSDANEPETKKEPAQAGRLDGKQGEIMELLSSLSDDQIDLVLERCRTLADLNQQQKK